MIIKSNCKNIRLFITQNRDQNIGELSNTTTHLTTKKKVFKF